ncbi:hypothetical protein [Burkholderia sp. JKS000303]|uniref:hypothetical protein n=1 Tax=Burkholderia sp. JKS000303 TaxID=1938747 RepID=UPI000BF893E2|nr:hypothetical protein [Burkholderia sp. JKS000303]PFH12965.1 hypothetical protein BX604_7385 [Burkholderia sp. JKS000303]
MKRKKNILRDGLLPRMEAIPRKKGISYRYHPVGAKPISLGMDKVAAVRKVLDIIGAAGDTGTIGKLWEEFKETDRWKRYAPDTRKDGQTKQLQLTIAANDAQSQSARQAADDIEASFTKMFANIAQQPRNALQAFRDFTMNVDQMLTQLAAKQLFNSVSKMDFGGGFSVDSLLRTGTSKLLGGDATGTTATTAHTTAVTADTTGITAMTAAIAAATAALAGLTVSAGTAAASNSLGGLSGPGGGLGGLFGEGTGGSNSWGFTMPDGSLGDTMPSIGGNAYGFTMPSYDVGTPFVPNDMIAQIHQGERITPAYLNRPEHNFGAVAVTNNFHLPQQMDMRTQSQIAAAAGAGMQLAMRRNG